MNGGADSGIGTGYPGLRIELEREPDKGVYDAMNKAMRRATGEWYGFGQR